MDKKRVLDRLNELINDFKCPWCKGSMGFFGVATWSDTVILFCGGACSHNWSFDFAAVVRGEVSENAFVADIISDFESSYQTLVMGEFENE